MTDLYFEVSSGLKSVLGSDLITDDEVALFELVKNSFDARATHVDIHFAPEAIVIADNGVGMSLKDIRKKWLFVAYSSKRDGKPTTFRDQVSERRHYAGSKGIGRFSSDRLGKVVYLQTRSMDKPLGPVHSITVDWDLFDRNYQEHFDTIKVDYKSQRGGFVIPPGIRPIKCGTVITIKEPKNDWNRQALLKLKSELSKLINPFGSNVDAFSITIWAPNESEADDKEGNSDISRVNGTIQNFIFEDLKEKTTFIEVSLNQTGDTICSCLVDRGELIYKIREPNPYNRIQNSQFSCKIFYLNQSAKLTFARRMGVPSVQFGSVFLFRNGFRIFPIGNEGDDWFEIDRRKQQGYARFLGTRDIIGRIDVYGDFNDFKEASSRNSGLIRTPAVQQLAICFHEKCLKRLERYIVPVTWADKEDKNSSDISRLLTDQGKARVTSAVAELVESSDSEIELIDYSQRLIALLNEKSTEFETSLAGIKRIAEKTQDHLLIQKLKKAEERFRDLQRSELSARKQADEERKAKEDAQARAERAEILASKTIEELAEEKKRSLFLASIATLDTDTILNLHHQITIYSVDIQQQIENFLVKVSKDQCVPKENTYDILDRISLLNRKIMGVSKFATKANFRLESEYIQADLGQYISQYINGVAKDFLLGKLRALVQLHGKGFLQKFKPIDISIVIDNLISNANKAKASLITFKITYPQNGLMYMEVFDDGTGFSTKLDDLTRIFEKGFTTTHGSGLGLYHVKQILDAMNGTIKVRKNEPIGACFTIIVSKAASK